MKSYRTLNTGPRGAKGRGLPAGISRAWSRRMVSLSYSPSAIAGSGASLGKSSASSVGTRR